MTMQPARTSVNVVIGDLFESDAQTLVNTVNTAGVMGKGVALAFKKRFPDMYADYAARCARGDVVLGRPYVFRRLVPPHVLNFPTKAHWRSVSTLADILRGLDHLEAHHVEWGITSLACPPLGCGNGGLEWRVIGPMLYRNLSRLSIPVTLFAPFGTPHEELRPTYLLRAAEDVGTSDGPATFAPSRLEPAWVALVGVLARLEQNPYHWPVGRISFQKLAYFATVAGIPTGFRFTKRAYGPYADELKQVQAKLINNGLVREEMRGSMIAYRVGPTFGDALRAYGDEVRRWEPVIERLAELMGRMRTRDAEMAATVHFAASALAEDLDRAPREREVLDAVLAWKQRHTPVWQPEEVALTIEQLAMRNWMDVRPARRRTSGRADAADAPRARPPRREAPATLF
jgi:O-acetyl-ADP-ribose deacetylase (regulator of RNase III)